MHDPTNSIEYNQLLNIPLPVLTALQRIFLTLPVLGAFYFVCIFFVFSGHANASFSSSPFLYACCLSSLLLSFAMMYHEQPFDVLTARNPTGETNYNIDIDSDTCLLVLNSMCCAIISICTYWPESMGGPSKVDSGEVPLSLSAIPVLSMIVLRSLLGHLHQ